MVSQALARSIPWFAFVNISFALIIVFRNVLFDHFDQTLATRSDMLHEIDALMLAIVVMSLGMLSSLMRAEARLSPAWQTLLALLLFALSCLWSFCCFYFVTVWRLPFSYPLTIILMLTALGALYFYPKGLLLFLLPIWLTCLMASVKLNAGLNMRFVIIWLLLAFILLYGRYILLHWFNENWQRYQDNRLLISRLETMANQDALTETANRRAMEHHLAVAAERQRPFALIMIDVDFFKRYNDHYGHPAGDRCLRDIAAILKSSVRSPEDVVARYGGEEFLLLLFDASLAGATVVAERIQQNIRRQGVPHAASEVGEVVSVSMGLAASSGNKSDAQLLAEADAALYRAKQGGRDRWQV
ncbi:GGDEF domain-containing protein [Serratia odorifera]|nr:membrane-associated sensor domain-containing protein [Serratia odorifera]PNK92862.1 GGDEF domain-containing protein [Serratia odorifera]RII70973.1 GGDEF domain-containing protein [Serratia odorifera]